MTYSHILFYSSNGCEHSRKILNIMKNNKILHIFAKYNILDIDSDKIAHLDLQMIPTIIVCDNSTRINSKFEGIYAFKFVEELISTRIDKLKRNVDIYNKITASIYAELVLANELIVYV